MSDKFVDSPSSALDVTDADVKEAVGKYPFLVVDCWAPWCGPCKMLGPIIETLAEKEQGNIVFAKLNVDENQATAAEYGIRSIPNLLIFKDGQKVGDIVGAMPEKQLLEEINKYK